MAIGDVYELKLSGNTLGQTVLNIFYYEMTVGSGGGASELGLTFYGNVVLSLLPIVSSDTTYTDIEIRNLANGQDFYVNNFSVNGTRGGTSATSFVAWGFRLNPVNVNFRAGGKRIGSVSNVDINDNAPVSGILSALNTVAADFGKALIQSGNTYRPRIKHQLPIIDTNAPIEYDYINVGSAEFARVTSQRTRMAGRGA